jgi:hypothetical protein
MERQDIERILRDVLTRQGVRVSTQVVEKIEGGWRVLVCDEAHRVLTTDVPDSTPAAIRRALMNWVDVAAD